MQALRKSAAAPRFIVSVVPDGFEEAQCIRIDHPSRLYITDDLIPTHNTYAPENEAQVFGDGRWQDEALASIAGEKLDQAAIMPRAASTFEEARTAWTDHMKGRVLANRRTGMEAKVTRDTIDKMLSENATRKSESPREHALAVANLDHLFAHAVMDGASQTALATQIWPPFTDSSRRWIRRTEHDW
ncbi:hypothetical protein AGMMS50256_37180 [Betaproteobacteria bacterium]|nr:hypothetical protein AGMMS50256_37180 [Betaproteobacteria bacterium]